jgi:hypothetical protein
VRAVRACTDSLATPRIGDVNRPENIAGLVWEEVAVKAIAKTVDGPRGPVPGAKVGRELHDDGTFSDKVFAPGYGEFYTAHEGDVEALALAVPADSLPGPPPAELRKLSSGADRIFRLVGSKRRLRASRTLAGLRAAWKLHRSQGVAAGLAAPTGRALRELARGVRSMDTGPLRARTRRRRAHRIDTRLEELRTNVADRELGAVMRTAAALRRALKQAPETGSASGLNARYRAPAARRG